MSGRLDYTDYSGPIVTRAEAKKEGKSHYFTGKRCIHGHLSQRNTKSSICSWCAVLHSRVTIERETPEQRKSRKERSKAYYSENRETFIDRSMEWRRENIDRVLPRIRRWKKQKRSEDINFRLRDILRCRVYKYISGESKSLSAVKNLGCSIEFLRSYLENKFDENMTWDNYGSYWHIDHIKPLSAFDLTDDRQFLEACHYTNLQPLEARENIRKGGIRRKNI